MTITAKGRIAGIIGWPVAHSLSPQLHGYWLEALGIDGAMVPLAVRASDFSTAIEGLRAAGFRGVNVTVPHKQAAFAIAHHCDAAARAAEAANLLVFGQDGRIAARNTDAGGLAASLRERIGALDGKTAVLVGTGGAARGAVLALDMLGAGTIHILGRSGARAAALAADLGGGVRAALKPAALDTWPRAAPDAALLVNATSAGMAGHAPLGLDLAPLPGAAAVCDIVYNPLQTPLLKAAEARGHVVIDGLGMLMHQAVPSFEAFFGVRPQVSDGLRAMLTGVLRARG
jgi:shikimate dehydrogenase